MKQIQNALLYLMLFSVNFGMWAPFSDNTVMSVVRFIGFFYIASVLLMPGGFFVLPRKLRPIYIPLVLFLLFLTLMSILNINTVSSRWFNAGMFQWTLMLLILANHERMRPLVLTRGMLVFAAGAVLMALMAWFDVGTETTREGRKSIFGENENDIGIRMSIGTIIILYHVISNPLRFGRWRLLLLATVVPMMVLLVSTGSRVGLIAVLGMLLALVFTIRVRNGILRIFYMALAAGILGTAIYYAATSDMMTSRLEATIEEGSMSGRQKIWGSLLPLIHDNPVIGVGETGYAEYSRKVFGELKSPHNVFLELMCYTGIVGTLLYLTFFFSLLRGAVVTFRRSGNFLPLLLFIPLMGVMLSAQAINVKTVWCVYAYIAGAYLTTPAKPGIGRAAGNITRKPAAGPPA